MKTNHEPSLHRNNAAEWIMVAAVWSLYPFVRLWALLSRRSS